jgi:mannosyltransferase
LRARDTNRHSLVLMTVTVVACVGWALASRYIAPEIIRSAYDGSGWSALNTMITGQASHPLLSYLTSWNVFAWRMLIMLLLFGLFVVLVARPEIQNAFWGPEPVICVPGLGAKVVAQGVSADAVNLSSRENPAGFAHSWEMALLVGAILPLALLLRLPSLGVRSFSEDEIFSVLLARERLATFWDIVTHTEANMVLYYAILRFWIHLGQSEFAIRSLSVIFALAAVVALYSLGSRAFGRQVGILAALLLAINGFHIEYSQEARSYSLLVFLLTLSSLFFLQSVREGSRRNWIRYIVTSTLAIYAHLLAILVLSVYWVFLLFVPRSQAPWRRLVPSTAAIAVLALPMELFVLIRAHGQLSWVPKTTVRGVYDLFVCLVGNPDHIPIPAYGTALLLCVYLIPAVLAILALAKSGSWLMGHTESWHVAFFLAWVWYPILLILAISMRAPAFVNRFFIICLPPFIILVSYGFSRLRRVWLVVALLCVITGLTAPRLLTYYKWPATDWRAAAQYVLSNEKLGDAAVFCPGYFESRLTYYLEREQAKPARTLGPQLALLVSSSDGSFGPLLQDLSSQYDRVWFISREEGPKVVAVQKRLIEASLAVQYTGIREEKRFSDGLVVVLYHK